MNIDRSRCSARRHGDESAYTEFRCRCDDSREAWRLYNKRRREGRHKPRIVSPIGATRRIQALVAIGWSWRALARESGKSVRRVQEIGRTRRPMLHIKTVAWVGDLYERLSATPGGNRYALTVAARYGFVPPLAWDNIDDPNETPDLGTDVPVVDRVVIDRALDGERVSLDSLTRHHAVHVGLARGMSETTVARHLRMSGTSVRDLAQKPLPDGGYVLAA